MSSIRDNYSTILFRLMHAGAKCHYRLFPDLLESYCFVFVPWLDNASPPSTLMSAICDSLELDSSKGRSLGEATAKNGRIRYTVTVGTTTIEIQIVTTYDWFDGLQQKLSDYHVRRFGRPEASIPKTYAKILEEVGELGEAIISFTAVSVADMSGRTSFKEGEDFLEEAADVFMVLTHLIDSVFGVGMMKKAVENKFAKADARLQQEAARNARKQSESAI